MYIKFRGAIAGVLDQALYPVAWLDARVATGDVDVMATDTSCILTEFKQYPSGAWEIHGVVAVGDVNEIAGVLIPKAEQYGRDRGCVIASIASRRGWAKVLPDYEVHQVELRKEL